jgi:hypothetical protein
MEDRQWWWAGSVTLGTHSGGVAGIGDFNGDRTADVMWHSEGRLIELPFGRIKLQLRRRTRGRL